MALWRQLRVVTMRSWLIDRGGAYVLVQFALFGVIWLAPGSLGLQWSDGALRFGRIFGGICLLYGLVMLAVAMVNLGRNLQAEPHPKDDATLVTNGAYRLVRHPIYSGIIIGWFGWGLFNGNELTSLLVLVLLLPFFDIKTRREERMLAAKFPPYADYQQRVRKLIPYIY